ncbi:MAG: tRNA delta(2)-isopentenylpyrophosphate transferase, partial [Gammaproteobacteria bacterium]|nr:tRNA delta(2)-isopentenylpyrophosphate transferase [Gammaproteobacteria bacterium]
VVIIGPTASGKSALALTLCTQFNGEIINVDSTLIYRHLNIGTAKPTPAELKTVPHHLIDIVDPEIAFSAGQFCRAAENAIADIEQRQHIPFLVGGTMLYLKSLLYGLSILPTASNEIRDAIIKDAQQYGWATLHERLKQVDPKAAARIHVNDPQRLQRALEIYYLTGKAQSDLFEAPKQGLVQQSHRVLTIAIMPQDRAVLHQRIATRFDAMLQNGLIEEVAALKKRPELHAALPSMRAVGYRQVWHYLDGEYDYATMRDKAIAATRQLAKRQFTWLRRWPEARCFDPTEANFLPAIQNCIRDFLSKKTLFS